MSGKKDQTTNLGCIALYRKKNHFDERRSLPDFQPFLGHFVA